MNGFGIYLILLTPVIIITGVAFLIYARFSQIRERFIFGIRTNLLIKDEQYFIEITNPTNSEWKGIVPFFTSEVMIKHTPEVIKPRKSQTVWIEKPEPSTKYCGSIVWTNGQNLFITPQNRLVKMTLLPEYMKPAQESELPKSSS